MKWVDVISSIMIQIDSYFPKVLGSSKMKFMAFPLHLWNEHSQKKICRPWMLILYFLIIVTLGYILDYVLIHSKPPLKTPQIWYILVTPRWIKYHEPWNLSDKVISDLIPILDEFSYVFLNLQGLIPSRSQDHVIQLNLEAKTANEKSYG